MMSDPAKPRLFEEHEIPTEGHDVLHARLMLPKPPRFSKRLVFIPPLIGAGASQPLIMFRNLLRRGCVLFSFEYRGHARSTGVFDLDKTIVDTRHALLFASNYARKRGLPLHGCATCYGAVALAAQFRDEAHRPRLWSFNVISALFGLDQILRFEDFAPVVSRHQDAEVVVPAILGGGVLEGFDWNGEPFRQALSEYLIGVFPELRVGRDHFEELRYERADIPGTLRQFLHARYLDGLTVPPGVPCNVFFGRNDDVLSLETLKGRQEYRDHALSLMPHAKFHECDIDHFGRGPDREAVVERLADIFEETEARAVPLDLTHTTGPLQDIRG